jgi:hypothetical protein
VKSISIRRPVDRLAATVTSQAGITRDTTEATAFELHAQVKELKAERVRLGKILGLKNPTRKALKRLPITSQNREMWLRMELITREYIRVRIGVRSSLGIKREK